MQDHLGEIEGAGGTLVAISADAASDLDDTRRTLALSFATISDTPLAIATRYGVRQKDRDIALPSTFVVDATGTVRFVHVGTSPVDRPKLWEILDALKR